MGTLFYGCVTADVTRLLWHKGAIICDLLQLYLVLNLSVLSILP